MNWCVLQDVFSPCTQCSLDHLLIHRLWPKCPKDKKCLNENGWVDGWWTLNWRGTGCKKLHQEMVVLFSICPRCTAGGAVRLANSLSKSYRGRIALSLRKQHSAWLIWTLHPFLLRFSDSRWSLKGVYFVTSNRTVSRSYQVCYLK